MKPHRELSRVHQMAAGTPDGGSGQRGAPDFKVPSNEAVRETVVIARVRVLESPQLTPTIHGVRFEKPPGFEFEPVQFCGLEIRTAEGSIEYPMSLACSPTRPYLEFGARISDSPWKQAFAALKPGDDAEIDGAYGHFVLDAASPAVLVAGGIGITPLKGMAEYAADRALPINVRLVYSNRNEEEIAYRSEIEELTRQNPHFEVYHTLTQAPGGSTWTGRRGRIDSSLVTEASRGLTHPVYYVCGAPSMVQGTYRILQSLGIAPDRIRYEVFRGYGWH
jgi:glycine betaine catabolism B